MKIIVVIPQPVFETVHQHLLQSDLEQGAFLFATVSEAEDVPRLEVVDHYLVPAEGWEVGRS